jgi:precorrin-6A/cobalt-precorrin-6A reductase
MGLKLLILGGTSDGRQLAERLQPDARFEALLSFAGRTKSLQAPAVRHRIGGFGGVEGLVTFLQREGMQALIDATHPFAAQMSRHAVGAAQRTKLPLLRVEPEAWRPQPGDAWTCVPDMEAAARALPREPRRVLLTVGRLEAQAFALAPQHDYLVRAVDSFDPGLPRARVITARGPFLREAEEALLRSESIDVIVSKNSGTSATYGKLEAARALGLPVIMVERPQVAETERVSSLQGALSWLEQLHGSLNQRGV